MSNWSVKTRIVTAFLVVIVIIIAVAVFTLSRLQSIRDQATDITSDSMPGLEAMAEIDSRAQLSATLTLMRSASSQDPAELRQLDDQIDANARRIDELMKVYEPTVHDSDDRRMFDAVKGDLPLAMAAERAYREASGSSASANDALRRRLTESLAKLNADINADMDFNKAAAEKDSKEVLDEVSISRSALIVALLAAIVVASVSAFLLVRAITRPLSAVMETMELMRTGDLSRRIDLKRNDELGMLATGLNQLADDLTSIISNIQRTGISINTSATEIAATSREHQATANEIAATTSEIGATSREISATSRELSRSMNLATAVAEKTSDLATSGQTALTRMEETIQQITSAAGSISAKLAVLSEKAGNIGSVVTTINKVADQTNLLSLNAAIEAEKAGEYGRGFAVVAVEIRRLADQTAVSTHDIEQMVKQMQSAVSAGVMGMEKFAGEVRQAVVVVGQVSDELSQIIEQVQTLTPSFESVNEGMDAQTVAAQQTVDSLRQSNEAIEQLGGATRVLQSGVSRFALQG